MLFNKLKTALMPVTILVSVLVLGSLKVSAAPTKEDNRFTVVIDAGHGGHDHGAVDNGAREKDINLGVARKLSDLISKKMKNVRVVMTRKDDTFISLQNRADIANKNKGNLFISIHTNSVDKSNPNRKKVEGASVYALGTQKNADNLKVAQRENSVIELERNYKQKYSGFDPSKDESYIIFEMAQKKTLGQSLKFADSAQKALVKSGRSDRGVKQAGFWVLWATSMPAVLVELDFICNPDVASYLNSDKGQEELAQALFSAFKTYVKAQQNFTENSKNGSDSGFSNPVLSKTDAMAAVEFGSAMNLAYGDEIGALVASTEQRAVRKHNSETRNNKRKINGPRKRRSSASKQLSESRNVETDIIILKSETDYLVKQEEPKEEVKAPIADEPNPKDKKKKKKKDKKKKEKKEKKAKPAEKKKKDSKRSNRKTIVIKNSGNTDNISVNPSVSNSSDFKNSGSEKQPSTKKDNQKSSPKQEVKTTSRRPVLSKQNTTSKMVYKILLVMSETELKDDDPIFRGVRPTGVFKENGLYKYTVGSSADRHEIEEMLFDIRNSIPEASIVVRAE